MAHAKLSPSTAERWLRCPGSVDLCSKVVDAGSRAADQGTAGHALFKRCLDHAKKAVFYLGEEMEGVKITEDMAGWVQEALDWVQEYQETLSAFGTLCGPYRTECAVEIGEHFGLTKDAEGHSDLWGTADLLLTSTEETLVFDLKLGYVDVPVQDNVQLMLYAYGEIANRPNASECVRLVIHQPRSGGAKEWVTSKTELVAWAYIIDSAVVQALSGRGKLNPSDEACRWCKASAVCPALREEALAVAREEFLSPETLTPRELGDLLRKLEMVQHVNSACRAHASALIARGQEVPGWKLVESRTHREWTDEPAARATVVKLGYTEDDMYVRKVRSPAQVEKLVGRKSAKELVPYIGKPKGVPTLVQDADPRPKVDAFEDFRQFAEPLDEE